MFYQVVIVLHWWLSLFQGIFFGGLDHSMRKIVWPFLLHYFPFQSTYEERESIVMAKDAEYEDIT